MAASATRDVCKRPLALATQKTMHVMMRYGTGRQTDPDWTAQIGLMLYVCQCQWPSEWCGVRLLPLMGFIRLNMGDLARSGLCFLSYIRHSAHVFSMPILTAKELLPDIFSSFAIVHSPSVFKHS